MANSPETNQRAERNAHTSNRYLENDVGLPNSFFDRMVHAATLAPSGDNLQPWSFSRTGETLLVRHDPGRDFSLFNVRFLASFIALGAAVESIAIAASDEGYLAKVDYFPHGPTDEFVAGVCFDAGEQRSPLAAVLDKRCTNRRPYDARPISPEFFDSIDVTRHFPTIDLLWVHDNAKLKSLGRIISRADRLIFENPCIHSHLFSTLRWTHDEVERTRDGLPIESLELGRIGSGAFRSLKRWSTVRFLNRLGFSKAAASHSSVLMQRCSAAGLITAPDTSPVSFLEAGRAFQRVWLQATAASLSLQPMTAIIFLQLRSRLTDYDGLIRGQPAVVDELRRELEAFFALSPQRVPAMLFRIGFATAPSGRTIRRAL